MWVISKDTVGFRPIKLMALVKKAEIKFCLNAFNLMNWKFKGKEQVESHLVNICFPWFNFNVSLETYFANITIIMIIPQYCHWEGYPFFFKKIPIHFSKLTASGLFNICVCVFSLKMAVSLFKIYNYFWVYKLISYL